MRESDHDPAATGKNAYSATLTVANTSTYTPGSYTVTFGTDGSGQAVNAAGDSTGRF